MIEIFTYSKKDFGKIKINDDNIDQFPNDYFICVNATGFIDSIPHFKKNHFNVLNCYFDDTDRDTLKHDDDYNVLYEAKAITVAQAKEIKTFILHVPSNSRLHIYCTKGKSRSPAIAKFAGKKDINIYNEYIYKLLCSI